MQLEYIENTIAGVCNKIAPSWPLQNSIAVNPFLGLSEMKFSQAAKDLQVLSDIQLFMPFDYFLERVRSKEIEIIDIDQALRRNTLDMSVSTFISQIISLKNEEIPNNRFKIISDIAEAEGKAYADLATGHISDWLAAFFNSPSNQKLSAKQLFRQWKKESEIDLLPELKGINNFRELVRKIPNSPEINIIRVLQAFKIPDNLVELYLHSLLLRLLGWASYCAGLDWQNNLYASKTDFVQSLLSIIISWEFVLFSNFEQIRTQWSKALKDNERIMSIEQNKKYAKYQSVLQDAAEIAFLRQLQQKFSTASKSKDLIKVTRPAAQMVFCIDVRSELYRRNIELVNENIETIGIAGFFGFPVKYIPISHKNGKNQCPALIPSGPEVYESGKTNAYTLKEKKSRIRSNNLSKAWAQFRSGMATSYSFVSPLGIYYLPKLISDSFGLSKPTKSPKDPEFGSILTGNTTLDISNIPFNDQLNMAKSALSAMGIKQFAPLVFITGHGASSVNNPHASGLDCGACGGNSGEINAMVAQLILNDKRIRAALKEYEFDIPADTYFIACLHNTTTDELRILGVEQIPAAHRMKINDLNNSFKAASKLTRIYRAPRLSIHGKKAESSILARAKDWSQVRPEWGLAGCHAFIIAPRNRTRGVDFEGRAFLHSYDWKSDNDFKILETIMTAPMIVTSWINLQYYASTVDNKRLGAGNKTLHNAIGDLGVLEGAGGDLRIGLPHQSIHDGNKYQHQPLRLHVIIEAPMEAVNKILSKHTNVKALCDNQWVQLLILDEKGGIAARYIENEMWEDLSESEKLKTNKEKFLIELI